MSLRWRGFLWVALSATGFGAMAIFAKLAYRDGVDLTTLLYLRFLLAGSVLALWGMARGMQLPRGRDLGLLIAMGAVGYVGQAYCYFAALRHANIYEAQGYRHTVSSTLVKPLGGETFEAVSNFIVVRIMHDGASALFASGRYVDRIRLAGEAKFEDKLVILDSRRVDTLLAIPL